MDFGIFVLTFLCGDLYYCDSFLIYWGCKYLNLYLPNCFNFRTWDFVLRLYKTTFYSSTLIWGCGLKMRAIARPIRHLRSVFRHQKNGYSSGLVRQRRKLMDINSGLAYKLTDDVGTCRFQDPAFMISRAFSVEPVTDANGGFLWIHILFSWLKFFLFVFFCKRK